MKTATETTIFSWLDFFGSLSIKSPRKRNGSSAALLCRHPAVEDSRSVMPPTQNDYEHKIPRLLEQEVCSLRPDCRFTPVVTGEASS